MENSVFINKIVTFSKCVCCNDCYFFFVDNVSALGIVPVYSKAGALHLLETCKKAEAVNEHDYLFFYEQIKTSSLPEQAETLDHEQQKHHLRKPEVMRSIYEAAWLLGKEARTDQTAATGPTRAQD